MHPYFNDDIIGNIPSNLGEAATKELVIACDKLDAMGGSPITLNFGLVSIPSDKLCPILRSKKKC